MLWNSRALGLAVLAALMCVLPASDASGQRSIMAPPVTGQMGVRLTLSAPLSVIGTNNLSFGQIAASLGGASARVEPDSPDAGRFELQGGGEQEIRVTYVAPTQLIRENGQGVIGINLEIYGAPDLGGASSAEQLLQNQTISLSEGRYFFFVGGELNVGPLNDNPPGIYSGELELEVSRLDL